MFTTYLAVLLAIASMTSAHPLRKAAANNGTILWTGPTTGFVDVGIVRGTNNTFYSVDTDEYPDISAVDGHTGKVVAKSSGGDKDAIIASMVVTNTSLYALSLHALLLRFDLTLQGTGTLLVQQGRIGTSITAAVSVTPDEKLVLVSAHNTLGSCYIHAISVIGTMTEKWNIELPKRQLALGNIPVSPDSQVAYVFAGDSTIALHMADGSTKWTVETAKAAGGALSSDGSKLFVASGSNIICLNTNTGSVAWTAAAGNPVVSPPVPMFDDTMLGVITHGSHLVGLNATDGSPSFASSFKNSLSRPTSLSTSTQQIVFVAETSDGQGGSGFIHALSVKNGGTLLYSTDIMNVNGAINVELTTEGDVLVVPADYVVGMQV